MGFKEQIVGALLSGQSKIVLNNVEIILKPLDSDTRKRKEAAAAQQADEIIKVLNS